MASITAGRFALRRTPPHLLCMATRSYHPHHNLKGFFAEALTASLPRTRQTRTSPAVLFHQARSMVVITQTRVDELPSSFQGTSSTDESSTHAGSSIVEPDNHAEYQRLIVTDSCYKRIQKLVAAKKETVDSVYLRVFVDAGGCSGFSYKFEVSSEELDEQEDVVFADPASGARVVVDKASLELINGSKIDYVQEMIKSGFEVRENPQSESACGCGSSFALKNFAVNPALD